MKFPKFQALLAAVVLMFSAGAFAQESPWSLTAEQLLQLESANSTEELSSVAQQLMADGVSMEALIANLAQRGVSERQIRGVLKPAIQAGVEAGTLQPMAVIAFENALPHLYQRVVVEGMLQRSTTAPVAITGAGLMTSADGKALVVDHPSQLGLLAGAFLAAQVSQNPNFLRDDPNAARGIALVLANGIQANNPSRNTSGLEAALLSALQNADFASGNAYQVLTQALQSAAGSVSDGITLPPVSAN